MTTPPPQEGTQFGPYQLRRLLGRGGMGEVFEAYDTSKDRVVALKLLQADRARDPVYQARFRRESQAAARLQEPHVIPIHDWGEIGGVLFIDMRLVTGNDLRAILKQSGPLPAARAVAIISQIASALSAAHATGLIHRDVKPENILLTPDDFAYLVDFGIAQSEDDVHLTSTGSAVGSHAYMAPERFGDEPTDSRADVYSLGCVLHECLTGASPFPSKSISSAIRAHLMTPPPRPSEHAGVPPAFDAVVAQALAKQPSQRYPGAGEFAAAARAALTAPGQQPPPPAPTIRAATAPPATYGTVPGGRQAVASGPAPTVQAPIPPPSTYASAPVPPVPAGRQRSWALPAGLAALAIAAVAVTGVILWNTRQPTASGPPTHEPQPTSSEETAPSTSEPTEPTESSTATTVVTTTRAPWRGNASGADDQGFRTGPRCAGTDLATKVGRSAQSLIVICAGPDSLYYRGMRLSDRASITLDGATETAEGTTVTNPADGTVYLVSPAALTMRHPDGKVTRETFTQFAQR